MIIIRPHGDRMIIIDTRLPGEGKVKRNALGKANRKAEVHAMLIAMHVRVLNATRTINELE